MRENESPDDNARRQLTGGSLTIEEDPTIVGNEVRSGICGLLYSPFQLHTVGRKISQVYLLQVWRRAFVGTKPVEDLAYTHFCAVKIKPQVYIAVYPVPTSRLHVH